MYKLWVMSYGKKLVVGESDNLTLLLLKMSLGVQQESFAPFYQYGAHYGVDNPNGEIVTLDQLEQDTTHFVYKRIGIEQ